MRLLLLSEHPKLQAQFEALQTSFFQEQKLKASQYDSEGTVFLFEYNNQIVGFAEVHLEEECFPDEDLPELCLHIRAFYIEPKMRHHGLGSTAFALVRKWGRDNEAALVETEAHPALENANTFLKDLGLELVGKGPKNIYRGFI